MDTNVNIKKVESLPLQFSESSMIPGVTGDTIREIGLKCKTRLDQLKETRKSSRYEDERTMDFDSYHLRPPKKLLPYAGYPNMACPLPRIGVDTFHANVMFTFGGQEGQFRVLPDFLSKSHLDVAKRAAEYMTYVLNYEADFYDALDKADMDAEKYENGFLKAIYVNEAAWETRTVTEDKVSAEVNPLTREVTRKTTKTNKTERVKRVIFDGIKVKRISPQCIFASPVFETVDEAVRKDYLFEVQNFNFRMIEELAKYSDKEHPAFFNASQVQKVKDAKKADIISRMERNKQEFDGVMVDRELALLPIELAEAHFYEDINGDGLAEKVSLVIETMTGIVLRASYAECRIVKLTPRPVDGRWDGESIRKAASSVVLEWEAIHNARVAKGQWENLPFFFYKQGGRFNPQQLTLMPGRGYPVDDPNAVNFPQTGMVGMSYFNEEKMLLDYFDRLLALGDVIQGVQGGGDASATNTIHSQQRAGIRLSNPMNRIAMAIERLLEHIWELNRQCAPKIKEYKVVGVGNGVPVFDKLTGHDYESMVSFKINMATMYDVQILRDSALLNYKTFMGNPLFMQDPAAFYNLTMETMRAVGLNIPLVAPEQAKVRSPFLEHDMIRGGEDIDPVLGEDTDEHLKAHAEFIKTEEFANWPTDRQKSLIIHYDKTQIQKQTLQAANLNHAGVFPGMPGGQPAASPAMTATRNPSQTFNNLRAGETGPSISQQPRNAMLGANNAQ